MLFKGYDFICVFKVILFYAQFAMYKKHRLSRSMTLANCVGSSESHCTECKTVVKACSFLDEVNEILK